VLQKKEKRKKDFRLVGNKKIKIQKHGQKLIEKI